MYNFTHDIGTIVHFGKGQIEKLPGAVKQYANKVLLTYGGGSIKKNGIYDAVIKGFKENGIEWVELSGIDPNPRVTSVREGQKICKEQGIEAIVAVGGGSTLDCSKAIACAAFYDGDPWDLWTGKAPIQKALPLLTVLTLSATGSEMDTGGVITNLETNDKLGAGAPILRPKVSILDPTYTYSVNKYQTAAGTADIISHVLEVYFSRVTDAYLQDRFCEALLKTAIHYGRIAMDEPENYEARANLMWTSSLAINDMIANGKACAWSVHPMEHELSAFFDITHGVGPVSYTHLDVYKRQALAFQIQRAVLHKEHARCLRGSRRRKTNIKTGQINRDRAPAINGDLPYIRNALQQNDLGSHAVFTRRRNGLFQAGILRIADLGDIVLGYSKASIRILLHRRIVGEVDVYKRQFVTSCPFK